MYSEFHNVKLELHIPEFTGSILVDIFFPRFSSVPPGTFRIMV